MNGVEPTYENISSFSCPSARPIRLREGCLKNAIPGIGEYLDEWIKSWGPGGILSEIGLVPSPDATREQNEAAAKEFTAMTGDGLK